MPFGHPNVDEVTPDEAYRILESTQNAALVDVRCQPEWMFVGVPDLREIGRDVMLIEWAQYPTMAINDEFLATLDKAFPDAPPEHALFICRSGQRSMSAAHAAAEHFAAAGHTVRCTNVAEGFEGPPDPTGKRGRVAGWKARGLPWRQA